MRALLCLLLCLSFFLQAQEETHYSSLEFRNIGPFRGGRSSAVTGVPGKPNLYYFGGAGGGVWQTKDGGQTWTNISDGYFGGSIGAVAVAESNPNVIYVGGGEKTVRGNVSYGYGAWKSIDGGKSWASIGLKNSRHISRIRIDQRDPDLVYAAVMGDLFKDSEERGIYRSKDGGKNWERVLFAGAGAGAVDLSIDPGNPRVMFASTWKIRRTPYSLESGGEGSALWRSTDGGDTWTNISDKPGLPSGTWGINAVAVSPVDGNRVYALIENEKGGVYVSNDGGDTWSARSDSRALRQRAWYYTRIYADPQDIDGVYVVNVSYHHSTDGGNTFKSNNAPHGDHHDLWIAPEDPERMIIADDGGAQVSFDRGENWSTYHNQPTSQFYRVVTDNSFPYRIYGAQQDNSTVRIRHRSDGRSIGESDWEETAGGESAHIAPDPLNPDIVYGGSYGGFLTRYDHENNQVRAINVWPDNPMGYGAEGMKYRFQWNFPIFFSPNDPKVLYTTSQHLHRSTDEGETWQIISPDLTRNEAEKLVSSGGPITKDNTGVEYYATIFAACESHREKGVLWTASDDGLVYVSRDSGGKWDNVTPTAAPKYIMWNSVEVDNAADGGLFLAGTSYKSGDYSPYLFHTRDYGKTWTRIDNGIPRDEFTRVVRQYPSAPNILFAGTEAGLHISFNGGKNWRPFQRNLPIVPITDLTIKDDNLIVATQGRSFWILDDLTPLKQLDQVSAKAGFHLFDPADAWRMGGSSRESRTAGTNHPGGVNFHIWLSEEAAKDTTPFTLTVEEYGEGGDQIRTWSTTDKENKLKLKAGGQTINWDLSYPDGVKVPGMILWWAGSGGPMALPGEYRVTLQRGDQAQFRDFIVKADPRVQASEEDMLAQFNFMKEVQEKTSEAHQVILDLRDLRDQVKGFQQRLPADASQELKDYGKSIIEELTKVEEALYQTKNRSGQDPLNYPIRLTNKLAHLNSLTGIGTYKPTAAAYAVKAELEGKIDLELAKYRSVVREKIPAYNKMILEQGVQVIKSPDLSKESRK
ncbi:glycosyl hydrolase [Neolewinella lacunae]|uniref:Glycosyl hydrolase n=1 Tax=Neolewinella lacunae TaxID=1517758 RepID=A0A923PLW1_9BACT|nr:sialidase family protein [Neolewinella lacunae]MBC6996563.1 glycosyl hydrolase [Neolewinella lacunae]MDN3634873.1 glycosyl hydrolase [Neolewinella lacunae]